MVDCQDYIEPDFSQAPGASVIYTVDWPSRGLPADTTIASQTFTPAGSTDYTISNTAIVDSDQETQFQITGGIPGTRYYITNQITLSDGEVMEATLIFACVAQDIRRTNTCL